MTAPYQKGFSLLEVLVAFVILSIFLGTLLPALGTGLRAERRGEQRLQAVSLGEQRLASIGRDSPLRPGTRTGESQGFRWREEVEPFVEPSAGANTKDSRLQAYRVMVQVAWGSNPAERISLTTLRLAQRSAE